MTVVRATDYQWVYVIAHVVDHSFKTIADRSVAVWGLLFRALSLSNI